MAAARVALAAICAAAAVLVASSPAQAAFPGFNGKIAFGSDRGGNQDVYTMNADGSGVRRLTTDPAGDGDPSFNAFGTRLAFTSSRVPGGFTEVFGMDSDGSGQVNLTNLGGDDGQPSFSPAAQIAYSRNAGGQFEIFAMNGDGSGQTNLTNTGAVGELQPAHSPSGAKIAFVRNFDILVMDANGLNQTLVTSGAPTDSHPAFSPDGSRIAFTSDRDGSTQVYVMNANGTAITRLTFAGLNSAPAFSPDGSRIVFVSDRSGNPDIWAMNADGSGQMNLTADSGGVDSDPDWGVAVSAAATPPPPAPTSPSAPPVGGPGDSPSATATVGSVAPSVRPPLPPAIAPMPLRPTVGSDASRAERVGADRDDAGSGSANRGSLPGEAITPPRAAGGPASQQSGVGTDTIADDKQRSSLSSALVRPDQLYLSAEDLQRSVGIAILLVALLGFPARLFNATIKANRHEVAGFFAPVRDAVARLKNSRAQVLLRIAGTSTVLATAIHVFLDPGFPSRPGSTALALGMFLGFAVIIATIGLTWRAYMRRYAPDAQGGWTVYPAQLAVSAFCVVISRLGHFVPGLIFGMSGNYEPSKPLSIEHLGRRFLYTLLALIAITLVAWTVSIPVAEAAADGDASFALLTLDTALAVITLAGIETIVFTGMPLMFLDGYALFLWRPRLWFAIWFSGVLWFSIVVLNPALSHYSGEASASLGWLAALLAIEVTIAVSVWAFFTLRSRRSVAAPA